MRALVCSPDGLHIYLGKNINKIRQTNKNLYVCGGYWLVFMDIPNKCRMFLFQRKLTKRQRIFPLINWPQKSLHARFPSCVANPVVVMHGFVLPENRPCYISRIAPCIATACASRNWILTLLTAHGLGRISQKRKNGHNGGYVHENATFFVTTSMCSLSFLIQCHQPDLTQSVGGCYSGRAAACSVPHTDIWFW